MCDVGELTSKRASEAAIQTVVQLRFPHGSSTSLQKHTHTRALRSWLFSAVATAGVSRQQAPAPAQPALWAPWRRLLGSCEEGNHCGGTAQLSSEGFKYGWGGFSSLLLLCHYSLLLPGSLCYIYLIPFVFHLIYPSFICPWLPLLSLPAPRSAFICVTLHALSLSLFLNSSYAHPTHLSHFLQNKYARQS